MTEAELAAVVRGIAPIVRAEIAQAVRDLTPRLAAVEATLARWPAHEQTLGDLRDRVISVETKVAQPAPAVTPIDLTPVLERLAATDARLQTLGDLRDRVVTLETKAALPIPPVDLGDVRDRLVAVETKALTPHLVEIGLADLRDRLTTLEHTGAKDAARLEGYTATLQRDAATLGERLAVLETRPLVAGPPGEPGAPGRDGVDGQAGAPGLAFDGVYQDGKAYAVGHLVTWAGSSWHCNEPTTTKPGDGSKAWTLMVKRGRDGRDGVDAPGALPVVKVR